MPLSSQQRKQLKAIAHHLKPIVTIAGNGISESVLSELERALEDHELIKIKIVAEEREDRVALIHEITRQTQAELVHSVGKTAVLVRYSNRPKPKLSNLLRSQSGR